MLILHFRCVRFRKSQIQLTLLIVNNYRGNHGTCVRDYLYEQGVSQYKHLDFVELARKHGATPFTATHARTKQQRCETAPDARAAREPRELSDYPPVANRVAKGTCNHGNHG